VARANANNPDLSVWMTGFEASLILRGFANAGKNFAFIHFKIPRFEVDHHNFSMIACFDLRSNL
jgi:hypothetical protein